MLRVVLWVLLALTFALLILGGVVHSTGSSLACPDWPTCYGTLSPPMSGGIFYEHSHRVLAASVACLSFVVAVLATLSRPHSDRLRRASYAACALVLLQALLGGLTVLMRLPPAISTAHLALGMLFFATLVWMVWVYHQAVPSRGSRSYSSSASQNNLLSTLRERWPLFATALCYLQIVLGAAVRHSGAALACPDFPGCGPDFWPPLSNPLGQLQMTHRSVGVLLVMLVVGGALSMELTQAHRPRTLMASRTAAGIVLLQVFLGSASVSSSLDLVTVSLHLGVAALLLANLLTLHLELVHLNVVEIADLK